MSSTAATSDSGTFDPDAMRERYRVERDKRLRSDGNAQYIEISDDYERFIDDKYVAGVDAREPLTDEVEVVLVGGGFGGLLAGARLRQAGVSDIRIIEKGAALGGTWYW
ncbi:MAG: NAD(P)-binding protein, partial [Acidimicrobiia bacterium]|nr:NAD(P)-binding protein [Acidimicrobiia bacterium]